MITRQIGPGMLQQMQGRCDQCAGEGTIMDAKDRCRRCQGRKTVQEQKIIEVAIVPGMRDNQKIVFHNEGDQEVSSSFFHPLTHSSSSFAARCRTR